MQGFREISFTIEVFVVSDDGTDIHASWQPATVHEHFDAGLRQRNIDQMRFGVVDFLVLVLDSHRARTIIHQKHQRAVNKLQRHEIYKTSTFKHPDGLREETC